MIAVCRELTKLHEESVIGLVADVRAHLSQPRGEFTVVVEAASRTAPRRSEAPDAPALSDEVGRLLEQGVSRTDAVRAVAARFGVPRREVYRAALGAEPRGGD